MILHSQFFILRSAFDRRLWLERWMNAERRMKNEELRIKNIR